MTLAIFDEPLRYLIVRPLDETEWMIVSNPTWDSHSTESLAWRLLQNTFNSYVEYENSGVVYRVVRSLDQYKLAEEKEGSSQ